MILGTIRFEGNVLITHRSSYKLGPATVFSVARPLFGPSLLLSAGAAGFGIAFADLLYTSELIAVGAGAVLALAIGSQVGQLKLLSRDLRGSDLASVIWGRVGRLNAIRAEIVAALRLDERGDAA